MEYEAVLFLLSVGMGAVLCLCYELISAMRNLISHHRVAVAAEDIIYWAWAGIFVFSVIYHFNQGILRSFLFLGSLLGAWLCHHTVGPVFRRSVELICGIPVKIVKKSANRLLFLFKSCSILVYKHHALHKMKVLEKKRISQFEKVKKKKDQKKNSQ